jgi:hypothetical protein
MKSISIPVDDIIVTPELTRSATSKQFLERLKASIAAIGLAEPIKVAKRPDGKYLIVDGVLRMQAVATIRREDASAFASINAYVVDYEKRYELRYQTDIYQDLLPSQLASLVEHLHQHEHVSKADIASYIGVSPATLRNYTGLWRLVQRGGLFARIVELMDVGILPASNPFAWLRLNDWGIRYVVEELIAGGKSAEGWIDEQLIAARKGEPNAYPIKFVESVTSDLTADCYREDEDVRTLKRNIGLRRTAARAKALRASMVDTTDAVRHLRRVAKKAGEPVLQMAAHSFAAYLR